MSTSSSGAKAGGSGTAGSASHQANDMTRNFILGIPKEGLNPNSEEAAELQAAEVFVNDIQQEILAYDIANAEAMATYARKVWSHVPVFGRRARESLEAEAAAKQAQVLEEGQRMAAHQHQHQQQEGTEMAGGLAGLDAAKAAELATGAAYLHTQSGGTTRGGFTVERTSAVDKTVLEKLLKDKQSSAAGGTAPQHGKPSAAPPKMNTWLFKKKHPGWTPLMQRWWVPWVCLGTLVLVWTPDVWKLRTLYYLDWQYTVLRQNIHKAYWRATMRKEDYEALIADIEAQRPSKVKATDCPF